MALRIVETHNTGDNDEESTVLGSIRRILGDSRAVDSSQAQGPGSSLSEAAGSREKAFVCEESIRRDRICLTDRHSVEGPAQRDVWLSKCDPSIFLRVALCGIFRRALAPGAGRVR